MLRETRRNLYSIIIDYLTRPRLARVVFSTYICEIILGITLIISALKLASIALGVGSRFNLISRYLSISLMVGMTVIMIASVKYLSTSSRMWGLPERNIRMVGKARVMSCSDSRSSRRFFGRHSSKPSIQMNTSGIDAIVFLSISTKSRSCAVRPPNALFSVRKTWRRGSGIPSLSKSCLRIAPNMFVADCCSWAV